MIINIGSKNKNKVNATKRAINDYTDWNCEYNIVEVDSGISKDPMSLDETVSGAINRAKNAYENCDYSIGLENGIMESKHVLSGCLNIGVCAIYDGNVIHIGLSPAFEHPAVVSELISKEGLGLNAAYKKAGLTDKENLGADEGAVGVLTSKKMTREDYVMHSVVMSLMHLLNS